MNRCLLIRPAGADAGRLHGFLLLRARATSRGGATCVEAKKENRKGKRRDAGLEESRNEVRALPRLAVGERRREGDDVQSRRSNCQSGAPPIIRQNSSCPSPTSHGCGWRKNRGRRSKRRRETQNDQCDQPEGAIRETTRRRMLGNPALGSVLIGRHYTCHVRDSEKMC